MKSSILFYWLLLINITPTVACTTFFINKNGQLIFGRNYDWISDAGMVTTNLKGLLKTSLKTDEGNSISWISKFGSITFNQFGKEFPTGGMNDQGLVVEMMWADGTKYPEPDNRPALGVLQWIQYQLDNHSTIEEVIGSDIKIRISKNHPPVHYLVADGGGNAATIEFFEGKAVIHRGDKLPIPVLTNSPYSTSAKSVADAIISSGNTNVTFQDNSLQRFAKACSMVKKYDDKEITKPVIDYAFEILNDVSVQDFTKWSIVYDLKKKKIYFKTASYADIKSVSFNSFDFNCTSTAKSFNMNQQVKGDVDSKFETFTDQLNRIILERAVEESKSQVPLSVTDKEMFIYYAGSIRCNK